MYDFSKLVAAYDNIPANDPVRIEAEKEISGMESRDFYRGMVNGVLIVSRLLEAANYVLPRWLSKRITAFAARASVLAVPLADPVTLLNPSEYEIFEAFFKKIGYNFPMKDRRGFMGMLSLCSSGALRGDDFHISWHTEDIDYYITIRGGRAALDSL